MGALPLPRPMRKMGPPLDVSRCGKMSTSVEVVERALDAAAERADFAAIEQTLGPMRGPGIWADRTFYIARLAGKLPLEALDGWRAAVPNSAVAALIRGRARIETGAQVRGGDVASRTAAAALHGFEEWLALADEDLRAASMLDAYDPTPYVSRLRVLQGTGRRAEAPATFRELQSRDAHHFAGHHAMLMTLTRKWGGSHEAMFDFARHAAATRAGTLPLLVAVAHLERWIGFEMEDDSAGADRYGADPAVRGEIQRALHDVHASGALFASRSTLEPMNVVAFWAWVTHDDDLLRWMLPPIGERWTDYPWLYMGGARGFEKARRILKPPS